MSEKQNIIAKWELSPRWVRVQFNGEKTGFWWLNVLCYSRRLNHADLWKIRRQLALCFDYPQLGTEVPNSWVLKKWAY